MLNRKYFPFERNSYYFGKLLTAKDFEAEQRYINDKRRFTNRILGANGIVAGLGVVMADDTSVIVQAGCALDASGREIVVPETRVVKLSTIEGFDSLASTCVYLGLCYDEQPVGEVYAAMGEQAGGGAFNKIQESYKLVLLDESSVSKIKRPLDEFVTALTVYSDNEVAVTQYVPKFVSKGCDLSVRVEIKKLGGASGEYSFGYLLDTPGFAAGDGSAFQRVDAAGVKLARGETADWRFTFTPKHHVFGGGALTMTASDFVIQKNGENFQIDGKFECQLKPVAQRPSDYFLSAWYEKAMDKTLLESYDERLWIAKIDLFRQKSAVIIDKVSPPPFGQYTWNAQQLMRLRELESFFPKEGRPAGPVAAQEAAFQVRSAVPQSGELAKSTASGVFEIGLGLGYSTRDPVFSEEIMHGLGKGPVYVEVGVEYISAGPQKNADQSEIILGDVRLFSRDGSKYEGERIYNVTTAVKVLPERGTFVVAVQPKETSGLISLRIRWFAVRMVEQNKQIRSAHDGEKYILINPDTIVVPPKGTAHISPVFINMPTEACSFRMVDAEGGTIDNTGVYTAPAKEGVYEIRVEAISDPSIYTHAFAIVTQKKKTEKTEGR